MSHGEEPAGLEGYAAYDGHAQDEWMKNYFQPTGFAPVHHHVPVDGGLYASYASDVSDISVASIAEDMYDPALIPQGYEAPVVFDNYAYGGYNPAMYMPQQRVQYIQQPRQVYQTMQMPEYEEYYVEDEMPMMGMQQQVPMQQRQVQQVQQVQHQVPRVAQHQLPSQAQLREQPQQNGWATFQQAPQQPPNDAQWAQIGISIWQKGSWHVIASVTPGSCAQTMGLQPGDVLRKLDRIPVKGWDHDKIMSKLQGWEGSSVIVRTNTKKLKVIRDCAVTDRPVAHGAQPQTQIVHQPGQTRQFVQQPVQHVMQQPVQHVMQQPVQHVVQQPMQRVVHQQPVVQQRQIQFVQQPVQQHMVQQVPVQPQQFVMQVPGAQQVMLQPQQQIQHQVIRQVVQAPQQHMVKTIQAVPGQFAPGMQMQGQPMMMQF